MRTISAFTPKSLRHSLFRNSLVTIVFRQAGAGEKAGTELAFKHEQLFDETVRDNHKRGWSESFAKLDQFLRVRTDGILKTEKSWLT